MQCQYLDCLCHNVVDDRKPTAGVTRCLTTYTSTCIRRLVWSRWQWSGHTAFVMRHHGSSAARRLHCSGMFLLMRLDELSVSVHHFNIADYVTLAAWSQLLVPLLTFFITTYRNWRGKGNRRIFSLVITPLRDSGKVRWALWGHHWGTVETQWKRSLSLVRTPLRDSGNVRWALWGHHRGTVERFVVRTIKLMKDATTKLMRYTVSKKTSPFHFWNNLVKNFNNFWYKPLRKIDTSQL